MQKLDKATLEWVIEELSKVRDRHIKKSQTATGCFDSYCNTATVRADELHKAIQRFWRAAHGV